MKQKMMTKMLGIVKAKTGIDLSGHIVEMTSASPWTFARYFNAPEGTVYGFEVRDWDGMMPRMMMLAKDFPIKGLRPIDAADPSADGYSAASIRGSLVGKLALKDHREWAKGGNQ